MASKPRVYYLVSDPDLQEVLRLRRTFKVSLILACASFGGSLPLLALICVAPEDPAYFCAATLLVASTIYFGVFTRFNKKALRRKVDEVFRSSERQEFYN